MHPVKFSEVGGSKRVLCTAVMSDNSQLPKPSDFPPGDEFVIKEFDVPLVRILDGGSRL